MIYDRIEMSCVRLVQHPQLGRARPEIAPDARALVIERWLALYRVTAHYTRDMFTLAIAA